MITQYPVILFIQPLPQVDTVDAMTVDTEIDEPKLMRFKNTGVNNAEPEDTTTNGIIHS